MLSGIVLIVQVICNRVLPKLDCYVRIDYNTISDINVNVCTVHTYSDGKTVADATLIIVTHFFFQL